MADLICAFWGHLSKSRVVHQNCGVIVTTNEELCHGCTGVDFNAPVPRVCPCECQTCKRAWWAEGRPKINDAGEIVRAGPENIQP